MPWAVFFMTSLTHLDFLEFGVAHLLLHGHDSLPLRLDLELLRPGSGQRFGRCGPLHGRPVVQRECYRRKDKIATFKCVH